MKRTWVIFSIGLFLFLCTPSVYAQFTMTWQTSSNNESITIPTFSGETYNYNVDWGDLSSSSSQTGDASHTYASAGTYTVSITGTFPRIYFNNTGDKTKIMTISNWGTNAWTSMSAAFMGCSNLTITASDFPNLTGVTSLSFMFAGASSLNQNLGGWTTSTITNMSNMFNGATAFNQDISGWTVNNVISMNAMFQGASAFNQDISGWTTTNLQDMTSIFANASSFNQDISGWTTTNANTMSNLFNGAIAFNQDISGWTVSGVLNMAGMFNNAQAFNQDISGWNVSAVTNMSYMFTGAISFNQDIGGWTTTSLTEMRNMFNGAASFNQDISGWNVSGVSNMAEIFRDNDAFNQDLRDWDVSGVTDMTGMFRGADSFNQNLGDWTITLVANMSLMLDGTAITTQNYDSTLIGWAAQTVQSGVSLGAQALTYCNGETHRQSLITDDGWSFSSDTKNCGTSWNGSAWNEGTPVGLLNATITAAYNVATHGDISCNNLSINASQTLTMASGNISLTGNFDNNGNAFTQTGGSFTFNGSSAQNIEGNNSFDNLIINNAAGVTLNSTTNVTGILSLTSGVLASGGNLTLKSTGATAGSSATIDFSGSGSVSGNVTIERFLDGATQQGYRYVATNLAGQTLASISDNQAITGLGTTFSPGSGAGYTWTSTNPFPNIFIYDQSLISGGTAGAGVLNGQSLNNAEYGWETPSATSDALNPGTGLVLLLGASDLTLDFTGTLQSSDVVLSLSHGGQTNSGWHLVGNPFAATLDWNAVYDDGGNSGIEPTAYVFDASSAFAGTYAGYNASTNMGVNGGTQHIASGQALFIQTTSGMTGNVTMKTSHTSSTDVQFFKTQEEKPELFGELRLILEDERKHKDELLIYFMEEAQEGKDLGDSKKFFDGGYGLPLLASQAYNQDLMMDCRAPLNGGSQSYKLKLKTGEIGTYTLKASMIDQFTPNTQIVLEDRSNNVLIDLNQISAYRFDVTSVEEVFENRFWVHLRENNITSIEDDFTQNDIATFAYGHQVNIQFTNHKAATAQIAIYNLMGQLIHHQTTDNQLNIAIPIFKQGIYLVKVENNENTLIQKVFIR